MTVAAARAMGAAEVSLEARYPHQIELGERLGATETSGLYDVVIEAAGSESSLHRCTELARPGGTMGVLGVFGPEGSRGRRCSASPRSCVPSRRSGTARTGTDPTSTTRRPCSEQ